GFLATMYPIFQMASAPILGSLSDRYGRRPVLLFSLLGTVAGFLLLGSGRVLWMLFLGRIVDGASAGNVPTAFAYVADITPENKRAGAIAFLSVSFWLGAVMGP